MQLNRRELAVLSAIILGWACLPLGIHFLAPRYSDQAGPIMLVGGVVASVAAIRLLWVHSQRLTRETTRRLALLGFAEVSLPIQPDHMWFPAEHRHKNPRIDGFAVPGDNTLRKGYQRDQDGMRITLFGYGYSTGGTKGQAAFQAARFECPLWNWPSFSAARANAWSEGFAVKGWTRLQFPEDQRFNRDYWVQASNSDPVRSLFSAPVRELLQNNSDFRLSAEGHVLTVYCGHLTLVPGEAEQLLQQAGQMVTRWTTLNRGNARP